MPPPICIRLAAGRPTDQRSRHRRCVTRAVVSSGTWPCTTEDRSPFRQWIHCPYRRRVPRSGAILQRPGYCPAPRAVFDILPRLKSGEDVNVQLCRRGMNWLLLCMAFDATENEKSISAFRVLSVGNAIFPAVSFGLSSAGQCRVMAHQMMSSRKLFPSPLSPVKRFRRGPKSSDMQDAGPTLDMPRCVIKPETPFHVGGRRALPACRISEPCQQFKEAVC